MLHPEILSISTSRSISGPTNSQRKRGNFPDEAQRCKHESDSTDFSGDILTTLTGMAAHAIYTQERSDRKALLGGIVE